MGGWSTGSPAKQAQCLETLDGDIDEAFPIYSSPPPWGTMNPPRLSATLSRLIQVFYTLPSDHACFFAIVTRLPPLVHASGSYLLSSKSGFWHRVSAWVSSTSHQIQLTLRKMTSPSSVLLSGMYSSSSSSARSPYANNTGVLCVCHPVIVLGRPAAPTTSTA